MARRHRTATLACCAPRIPEHRALTTLSERARAQWQIHFCVLLWGFTAILGKLITLPALPLVWWRMLIVVAVLALLPRVWRGLRAMPPRLILAYAGIGVIIALTLWLRALSAASATGSHQPGRFLRLIAQFHWIEIGAGLLALGALMATGSRGGVIATAAGLACVLVLTFPRSDGSSSSGFPCSSCRCWPGGSGLR